MNETMRIRSFTLRDQTKFRDVYNQIVFWFLRHGYTEISSPLVSSVEQFVKSDIIESMSAFGLEAKEDEPWIDGGTVIPQAKYNKISVNLSSESKVAEVCFCNGPAIPSPDYILLTEGKIALYDGYVALNDAIIRGGPEDSFLRLLREENKRLAGPIIHKFSNR